MMMDRALPLLLAMAVGCNLERNPRHLIFTTVNLPPPGPSIDNKGNNAHHHYYSQTHNSQLNAPDAQRTISMVPYSNLYPFYALWNNVAQSPNNGVGRPFTGSNAQPSGIVSNKITAIPSERSLGSGNGQESPHSLPLSQTPFVVPFASVAEAYQNLWNYDINSLKHRAHHSPQHHQTHSASAPHLGSQGQHFIMNRNDQHWTVPVEHHPTFQRGQVESFPYKSSAFGALSMHPGFTREHIEAIPMHTSKALTMSAEHEQYKIGFIRGAVESSNYVRQSILPGPGGRVIRYDANDQMMDNANNTNKVVCYFSSWSFYRKGKGSFTPENVDPNLCTHVVYAFANLDKSKFAIKESDPQLDNDKAFYKRVTGLKQRNPRLKVLLGLGGWSDSGDDKYSRLANSAELRKKFARETLAFLKERDFDGLSLDWHYPKCWQSQCDLGPDSDKMAFSELIKELNSVFKPEGLVLSATLSGYKEVVELAYDIPTISQYLDLMNVMVYDYHGAWESRTGHLAPLFAGPPSFDPYPQYNVNHTMQYFASKGADKSKLIMGVPMYGQTFHLSNTGDSSYGSESVGPGVPGEFTQQPGMLSYYEICSRIKEKQWVASYDRTGSWGPYAYKDNQWVGYDDSDFLIRKARYVKQQQFGGMFVWTMDLDDFQNTCCMGSQPLLRTIAKEMLGTPYDPSTYDCTPPVIPKPVVEVTTQKPSQGGSTIRPSTPTPVTSSTWWPQSSTHAPSPTITTLSPVPQPSSTFASVRPTTTTTPPATTAETSNGSSPSTIILVCHQVNGTVVTNPWEMSSTTTPASASTDGTMPLPGEIPSHTCDNTWVYKPHPENCNMYYQCVDGKVVEQKCPQGLHWNQYSHTCDWPSYAKCATSPEETTMATPSTTRPTTTKTPYTTRTTPTTTMPQTTARPPMTTQPAYQTSTSGYCSSGEYSPGPTCDRYYVCVSGTKTLQSCGPGLHWDDQRKLCNWPQSAMCQVNGDMPPKETIKLPKSCQEGQYLASEEDCEVYFVCNHGRPVQFRCQNGLHWNNQGKFCDWPHNVGCHASPATSHPESESTTSLPVTTTTTKTTTTTTTTKRPTTTTRHTTTTTTHKPSTTSTTRPHTTHKPASTTSTLAPGPGPVEPITANDQFMIVCYFTNWAWYRPGNGKYKPDDINPNLCTHIVYGFAVLDYTELIIKPHDTWADYDNHFYEQVTAFKKGGTKVTLAIGGWNDSAGDKYSRLVNNAAARKKFIDNVIQFLKKHNFDGLDLDWEYPKCWQVECDKGPDSDRPSFGAFVRELKEAFEPHGLLLSAAVSPSKTVVDAGYDVPTVSKYLDWISVMTYDFHGQWDKKTGHVAPLYLHEEDDNAYYNANYSINYWIDQGADRKKIVMGMPLYGQSFTLADPNNHGLNAPSTGGGTAGEFTRAAGFLSYYEICQHIQKDGWTVVQDDTGSMGPYAYKGNQWVSYDDVPMIKKKSQLIRDLNLGGGMIWALDLDDFRNTCSQGAYPLLTAIRNTLGSRELTQAEYEPNPGSSSPEPIVSTTTRRTTTSTVPSTPKRTAATTQMTTRRYPSPSRRPVVGTVETDDAFIIGEHDVAINHQQNQPFEVVAPLPPIPDNNLFPPPQKVDEQECQSKPYKPHETDCNKYYQCVFGNYAERRCPPGTYWHTDRCDWTCGSPPSGSTTQSSGTTAVTTTRPSTTTIQARPTTIVTTTQKPWSQAPSTPMTSWTPTTTKPSTSTSWEWKPPIITTTTINPVEVPDSEFMVVCYFTNWAWYRQGIGKYKPEDIDYNLCTHIAYGFAVLNPSTLEIRTHDSWADVDNQFYTQVTDLKSKGKKVVIAIGGWNDSLGDKYSRLVRDAAARQKFIKSVIAFIQKYNFDGLDLDWEYPKCWQTDCKQGPEMDKANFAIFCKEIKEAFIPYGYLLSAAVTPSKVIIDEGYDVPTINKYLDWIAVMTYDYHGQWDKKTGHVAPMYHHEDSDNFFFNSNYTINYWLSQGADKKKIVMGMPMYGQSFTLTQAANHDLNAPSTGGGQAGEFTRAQGFLAYYEICKNIKDKGWKVVRDESKAIGPYAYKGDQWVSFDDADMIRTKSQYIKDMGLGGGMIWALDLDDFRNVCGCEKHPLLKTINRVLRDYPEPDPKCSL